MKSLVPFHSLDRLRWSDYISYIFAKTITPKHVNRPSIYLLLVFGVLLLIFLASGR